MRLLKRKKVSKKQQNLEFVRLSAVETDIDYQ